MSDDEIAYFIRRANQEYAAARRARHAAAAMAHLSLAELYVDAIYARAPVAAIDQASMSVKQTVSAFG